MPEETKPKPFQAIDHGTNMVDLTHLHLPVEFRPTELHHKSNGDTMDEPSFVIVMKRPPLVSSRELTVYGQISFRMLKEAMNEIEKHLKIPVWLGIFG